VVRHADDVSERLLVERGRDAARHPDAVDQHAVVSALRLVGRKNMRRVAVLGRGGE
jgi:hypothetical protein